MKSTIKFTVNYSHPSCQKFIVNLRDDNLQYSVRTIVLCRCCRAVLERLRGHGDERRVDAASHDVVQDDDETSQGENGVHQAADP